MGLPQVSRDNLTQPVTAPSHPGHVLGFSGTTRSSGPALGPPTSSSLADTRGRNTSGETSTGQLRTDLTMVIQMDTMATTTEQTDVETVISPEPQPPQTIPIPRRKSSAEI